MKYAAFIEACRVRAKSESISAFARDHLQKEPAYLLAIMNGSRAPGREVLEAAAAAAKLNFEDCIIFPDIQSPGQQHGDLMAKVAALMELPPAASRSIRLLIEDFYKRLVDKPLQRKSKKKDSR